MADPSLILERCLYIGNIIGGIIYGLELYISVSTIHLLRREVSRSKAQRTFYIVFVYAMMLSQTISFVANIGLGQLMWIEHRDFPGGPIAYFDVSAADWENVAGSCFSEVANFMGDLLLIYRCYIMWGSRVSIITFPVIVFLASTAMAILALVQSAMPGSNIYTGGSVNFFIPWIALTTGLNVLLTSLISYRLLTARRRLLSTALPEAQELCAVYTSVVAILVESALPFSILGVALIIMLGKSIPVYVVFSVLWGAFAGLAPLLIIHRVALGRGWSKETVGRISTELRFANSTESTVQEADP